MTGLHAGDSREHSRSGYHQPCINPVEADVPYELFGAAVTIVKISKVLPLTTNIRRITGSLMKPYVRKPAIRLRPGIDVFESTVEHDMQVATV